MSRLSLRVRESWLAAGHGLPDCLQERSQAQRGLGLGLHRRRPRPVVFSYTFHRIVHVNAAGMADGSGRRAPVRGLQ